MPQKNTNIPWETIQNHVEKSLGRTIVFSRIQPVSGGDIHSAFSVSVDNEKPLFIKINTEDAYPVFISEAESLAAISATRSILTPELICHGQTDQHSYLVMEYLSLSLSGGEYVLGQQLATLHQVSTQNAKQPFGFDNDNYIGLTPQKNLWSASWSDFWIEQRFTPQLQLAYQNGFHAQLEPLETALFHTSKQLLSNHFPAVSLVHGDLWSGNKAYQHQTPVIFDPACYYADREVDIAMTELFGGFPDKFYRGYNDVWPLERTYRQRKTLYNLYHMLNHLNLFGSGYLNSVEQMINKVIRFD